ncbi:nSTAND1 domain-containing NTPase [Jidongwangia harbinensis]|uniref:nSTAND1 domain-containing NTPase n=1 Tax=Jidongwangia harbinensis TaxID=2878561 RepID=UPI001CD95755|nr:hypothetical protein [Jidongwangia harbinensis]MCA2212328.1 hypothetical protein [Jidongwangia harbinensis]
MTSADAPGAADADPAVPVERARGGVGAWARQAGRRAGAGLRGATPYGIIAFLTASAVAPVAGAALGAPADYTATLDQLGGIGGNYLSDTLAAAARKLREGEPGGPGEPDRWRDAIAAEVLARLEAGDERAAALRDEVAALLHAVDAVGVALRAADEEGQHALASAFGALGADVGRLQLLADDAAYALAAIQQRLAEQGRAQRQHTDLLRQSLVATAQLRQEVLGRVTGRGETGPPGPAVGGPAPYPGLASFQVTDARWFRGRETLVAELLGRLSEHLVGGPPVVVVGVSGVGKSSLLRAGVLPAITNGGLGEGSGSWPWLIMTPGAGPLAELTGRAATLAGAEPGAALAAVRDDPAGFGDLAARAAGDGRLIILVDQFEELFTQCTEPAERNAFAAALAAAGPALVLLAIRADFYPQCTELPALVPMLGAGQVVAGPLSTADLRRAVDEPARDAGLILEPGLAELLLTDVGALTGRGYEPGALPLLAHALRATWDRRDGVTLTVAGYRDTGGIRHAVAETAERIYLGLDDTGRAALRSALLGLVTVVGDKAVRHRAGRDEADLTVLRPLVDARLVTAGRDTVEISHEALLTSWPRLTAWLTEAREEIVLRRRLAQAAADWAGAGEDPDALYRGARLAAAREWAGRRTDLPETQRRFLAAGAAAAEADVVAQRRTTRRLRRLVGGLAVALLVAVGGGLVAVDQRGEAQDRGADAAANGRLALSRQLAAEARTDFLTDELRALGKAVDAWDAAPTAEARSVLMSGQHTTVLGLLGSERGARHVAVSPDRRRVAVGYLNGRIQLWDSASLRQVGADLRHPGTDLHSVAFSPDGRYLAAGTLSVPQGVAVWEVASGRRLRTLTAFGAVAWLPESSLVATRAEGAPAGEVLGVWDPADGRLRTTIRTGVPGAESLAVSRDGTYLAVGSVADSRIIRRTDGRQMSRLPKSFELSFAGDDTVVNVEASGVVTAWNAATGRRAATVSATADGPVASTAAVTPDGTVIVQGGRENEILRLKADGGGPRPPLTGFRSFATAVALSADGRLLAAVGSDSAPMLFRLGVDRLPHPQAVGYLAQDPGGDRLATGSNDPRIRIWDTRTSSVARTLEVAADDGPLGLTYARDRSLAAVFGDGRVLVFAPDGRLRSTFRVDAGMVPNSPAFSPDGSLLAVVVDAQKRGGKADSHDERQARRGVSDVVVWDVRTGRRRAQLETPDHLAISVTFGRDGGHLLAASNHNRPLGQPSGPHQDGGVWLWRTADFALLAHRTLPGVAVDDAEFSPDGGTVAMASSAGHAELLHARDLTPAGPVGTHDFKVDRIAWSPDGRLLATASSSDPDSVRMWEVRTNALVAEFRMHPNAVQDLVFSPDGRTLATASADWTVAIHRLDPGEAVRRICAIVVPSAEAHQTRIPRLCR